MLSGRQWALVNLVDMDGGMRVRDVGGVPTFNRRDQDEKRRIILGADKAIFQSPNP
jgi:hypothetical protein